MFAQKSAVASNSSRLGVFIAKPALACLTLTLLALLANYQALSCFFFADDFLCLDYLYDAFHGQPEIFLHRLVSAWQDPSISKLYRPVCDLLFFIDYLIAGVNPFFYHLSNLCLHILNTILLFYFLELSTVEFLKSNARITAFLSAALFAVYPVHVEAIVWIVCRADLLASLFVLLSLVFLEKALARGKEFSSLSILCAFLAFLSKESAATLPAVVFADLLILKRFPLLKVLRACSVYLVPLLLYFALRYFVLGTFIGGYSGSFAESISQNALDRLSDPDLFLLLGQGVNLSIFKDNDPALLLLQGTYVLAGVYLLLRIPLLPWNDSTIRCLLFCLCASIISLLPTFQVIGLSGMLSNARVFYLASLFYLPLLSIALYPELEQENSPFKSRCLYFAGAGILLLFICAFLLISWRSYAPWLRSGELLLKMQARVHDELQGLKSGQKLVVLNMLSSYRGAHMLYEFKELKTLLADNFFKDRLYKRLQCVDEFPDFLPLSTARWRAVASDKDKYKVLCFDLLHDSGQVLGDDRFPGKELESSECKIENSPEADGKEKTCLIHLPTPSEFCDSSVLEIDIEKNGGRRDGYITLGFMPSDLLPETEDLSIGILDYDKMSKRTYHIACIELRKSIGLSTGNKICIRLPENYNLSGARILASSSSALLSAEKADFQELENGKFKARSNGRGRLNLDVSSVPGAEGMLLERAEAGYVFSFGKTCVKDPLPYKHTACSFRFPAKKAQFEIASDRLAQGNLYAYRLIALNRNGDRIGFYSDNVYVDLR